MEDKKKNVTVLVLGDVGRSPRMQYHCLSLAKHGANVSLVGFTGKECCDELEQNKQITKYLVNGSIFKNWPRYLFPIYAPLKVLYQMLMMLYILLFVVPKPNYYLVQNPPSIPTLFLVYFLCLIQKSKFIIDWHNLGYTILGLSMGENNIMTKIYKYIERTFGQKSNGNLCVTKAMKKWLKEEWNIEASVLYDKPPSFFHKCGLQEKEEFYSKLATRINPHYEIDSSIQDDGSKPFILVSSTSWTPDEDFSILLTALISLDLRLCDQCYKDRKCYKVLCIVTGMGPLQNYYETQFKELHLKCVSIQTMWFTYSDYISMLGSSDLGVCLHTSSSGLDLPMKVVDMFGSQLPVCAKSFSALPELVQNNKNGYVFNTPTELTNQIYDAILDYYGTKQTLSSLSNGTLDFLKVRWDQNWDTNASVLFD
ncbi:hypothetical protein WA158_001674 [Blastocystis sp. Blastoise]